MEKVDLEAQLFLEEGGACRDIPHQQDRCDILQELPALGGEGGIIAIDARGEIALEFNSEGMFRASRRMGEAAEVAIYR